MADTTKNIPLSERELELLKLVSTGATNQQIARELVISVNTVKVHLRNIFEKMGVESRTEATLVAIREGWVVVESAADPAATAPATDAPIAVRRISTGQRIFLMAATVIVLGLMLWLPESARLLEEQSQSPFTERPAAMPLLVGDERTARWSNLAEMQTPRGRLAGAYYGGAIYAVAGDTDVGVAATLEKYDIAAKTWSSLPEKPTAVGNVSAVVAGGRIWAPGGFLSNGRITSLVETYDLETGAWATAPSLPEPVCAYALTAMDDTLYLFGGADSQGYLNESYRFDMQAGEWQALTAMPTTRAFASAATLDGLIYVVGGYDGQRELDTCEVYAPAEEQAGRYPWRECASLTVGRGGLGIAAAGSALYAVGGGWQNFLAYNEQYDPDTDRWTQFSTPVSGEWRNLALVADDKTLYAIGGWDGHYLGTLWAYQTVVTIFLPITP